MFPTLTHFVFYMKFSVESHHFLFVPKASETQGQVEHGGGVERAAGKLQRLRKEKQENYSEVCFKEKKKKKSLTSISENIKTRSVPPSITDLLLGGTVQYHWRPHNAVVPLVKVAVLGTVEVSQDKDHLEVCVVLIGKLLDTISGDAHCGVDVLQG